MTWNNDNIYYRRRTESGFTTWVKLIHSGNIGSQSVNYATSAGDATKVGNSSIWIYPEGGDEINFGGTSTNTKIYFGYREKDSRPKPTDFYFGGSAATANIIAAKISGGSGNFTLQWNTTDSSIDFIFA